MSLNVAIFIRRMGNGATILLLCILVMQWLKVASPEQNALSHSMYSLVELVLVIMVFASMYAKRVIDRNNGASPRPK
ncbi:MAG TPA: hypothetical protein VFJ29_05165 [Candidatus Kapabacteria bacterium]|nr:hypothetical protein [Candidatus Kapabacteria bacterium]